DTTSLHDALPLSVSSTNAAASRRYSGVYFLRFAITTTLPQVNVTRYLRRQQQEGKPRRQVGDRSWTLPICPHNMDTKRKNVDTRRKEDPISTRSLLPTSCWPTITIQNVGKAVAIRSLMPGSPHAPSSGASM